MLGTSESSEFENQPLHLMLQRALFSSQSGVSAEEGSTEKKLTPFSIRTKESGVGRLYSIRYQNIEDFEPRVTKVSKQKSESGGGLYSKILGMLNQWKTLLSPEEKIRTVNLQSEELKAIEENQKTEKRQIIGISKKKVWEIKVQFFGPVECEITLKFNSKRKLKDLVDFAIEKLQQRIIESEIKSYLQFDSFRLRIDGKNLRPEDLEQSIASIFSAVSNRLQLILIESNELSVFVSENARSMAQGLVKYEGDSSYAITPNILKSFESLQHVENFTISNKYVTITYHEPINLLKLDFTIKQLITLDKLTVGFDFNLLKSSQPGFDLVEPLEKCPLLADATVEFHQILTEIELKEKADEKILNLQKQAELNTQEFMHFTFEKYCPENNSIICTMRNVTNN